METKKLVIGVSVALVVMVVLVGAMLLYNPVVDDGMYIDIRSNTEYFPGETGQVIAELRNSTGGIINSNCTVDILYPDKSSFVNDEVMGISDGLGTKYYTFTVPYEIYGVYEYQSTCVVGSRSIVSGKAFHVGEAGKRVDQLSYWLTDITEENIDTAWNKQQIQSRWRVNYGYIYNVSCNKGLINYEAGNLAFNVNWTVNSSQNRQDRLICNVTIQYNESLPINHHQCYQETANVSTVCGGLSVGFYTLISHRSIFDAFGKWTDGNFSAAGTLDSTDGSPQYMGFDVTYEKPVNSIITGTKWSAAKNGVNKTMSIPGECWNFNSTSIKFSMRRQVLASPGTLYGLFCQKNNTGNVTWPFVQDYVMLYNETLGGSHSFNEEWMSWSLTDLRTRDFIVTDYVNVQNNLRATVAKG